MANAPFLKVRDWIYAGTSSTTNPYTDLTPYIAFDGFKIGRNDIDASDAGRDQSGLMHRARVAIKTRLDVTCVCQNETVTSTILTALKPEWLQVYYFDVQSGAAVTKKMYSNNITIEFLMRQGTNNYWKGVSFPLIEA